MSAKDTPAQIRLDERQHVEEPLLDPLAGLGWEIIDLDAKQYPGDSHRASFTAAHSARMLGIMNSRTCLTSGSCKTGTMQAAPIVRRDARK